MISPVALAQTVTLKTVFTLPRPLLRVLVGLPVRVDGNTLDTETQALLLLERIAGVDTLENGSIERRRENSSHNSRLMGGNQPIGRVEDLSVAGAEGSLPARLYVPRSMLSSGGPDPLLVYFHGGGWCVGDLDSHDAVCRFLAEHAGVRVLSVAYRLAPEHPYPAGPDDAWAAMQWAHRNVSRLGADPDRLAVGGDSAGGALAALTAIRAAETGLPLRCQLLIYPATRIGQSGHSRELFGEGYLLTNEAMDFFDAQYLRGMHAGDPGHSVGYRDDFPESLAPAVVAIAGFDPLRDEELDFVELLEKAGLPVTQRFYPGLVHGFANMVGHLRSTRAAMKELAADLRVALA